MSLAKATSLTKNSFVIFKGTPHQVLKIDFVSPGKGSAFCRYRLKSVATGSVQEFTYKSNEMIEVADVVKRDMQFIYKDGDDMVFMDPRDYDQISVPVRLFDGKEGLLAAETICKILWYEEQAIGVQLPAHVSLKVTVAEEAVAGNRVNAPKKQVTVETGYQVMAPLFIKPGDMIMIDSESGEYLSRVN